MKKHIFILFVLFPFLSPAQNAAPKNDSTTTQVKNLNGVYMVLKVVDGDTIPTLTLSPAICYGERVFKNKREKRRWTRLKYHVKKVYPYAILASARLKEYDRVLLTITDENDRKKYTKKV